MKEGIKNSKYKQNKRIYTKRQAHKLRKYC